MSERIIDIPLEKIIDDRPVFRRWRQEEGIDQLAASIEHHGQLEEVLVIREGKCYRMVNGTRRLQALKLLKSPTIRAKVLEDTNVAEAVTVNSHQYPLDSISKLRAVEKLLEENPGAEGKEIGREINLPASQACKYIRMARAIPEVRGKVDDDPRAVSGISMGVARELAYQEKERQLPLLEQVLQRQQETNKRLTRQGFRRLLEDRENNSGPLARLQALAESFSKATGVTLSVHLSNSRGSRNHVIFKMLSARDSEHVLRFFEELLDKESSQGSTEDENTD
jgi:ParB/RepB/Spo0J family partition protein